MECFIIGSEGFTTCPKALGRKAVGVAIEQCVRASASYPNAQCPLATDVENMRHQFALEAELAEIDARVMSEEAAAAERANEEKIQRPQP